MLLKFSKHARDRMILRGISVEEVKRAIAFGAKAIQKPNKLLCYYGHFCVVCRKIGAVYYVITVKPR